MRLPQGSLSLAWLPQAKSPLYQRQVLGPIVIVIFNMVATDITLRNSLTFP